MDGDIEELFNEYKGRRNGILKALTTDANEFYQQCDPRKQSLCLYAFPDEHWEVILASEECFPKIPKPTSGINIVRDWMQRKDWLNFVASSSDAWLLAVFFFFGARFGFGKAERERLFKRINDLPTICEVLGGGGTGDVNVLGTWWSPFALRTRVALNLKSIDYQLIEVTFEPKSELILKQNPVFKKIPVLIHNNKPISESLTTVQYINDVWTSRGPSIVPTDPYDRAMASFWSRYIDDELLSNLHAALSDEGAKKGAIDRLVEEVVVLEDAFKSMSNGKKFFGGDTIGYLDIALGSFIGWFKVVEAFNHVKVLDETKVPSLVKWAQDFVDHSAVKDVFPAIHKLVEFARHENHKFYI